jgi:hypothetical protein
LQNGNAALRRQPDRQRPSQVKDTTKRDALQARRSGCARRRIAGIPLGQKRLAECP